MSSPDPFAAAFTLNEEQSKRHNDAIQKYLLAYNAAAGTGTHLDEKTINTFIANIKRKCKDDKVMIPATFDEWYGDSTLEMPAGAGVKTIQELWNAQLSGEKLSEEVHPLPLAPSPSLTVTPGPARTAPAAAPSTVTPPGSTTPAVGANGTTSIQSRQNH